MRRLLAGSAMAVAAMLTAVAMGAGAAHADELFYPDGQEPASQSAPADDAGSAGDPGDAVDDSTVSTDDRDLALARGSRQAADLMGYLPSLYQGKWYQPGKEDVRRCILDRESNFNYRASSGTYHGAYQMSSALARGATWMMQKEVRKEMGEEGVRILEALRSMTPNKWNRYWQDRAFWTIWRNGEGAGHWRGGAFGC